MIVEEEPFEDLNVRQLEKQVGEGGLYPTSEDKEINASIKALLCKCWDRAAKKRPKAKEFQTRWTQILFDPLATPVTM